MAIRNSALLLVLSVACLFFFIGQPELAKAHSLVPTKAQKNNPGAGKEKLSTNSPSKTKSEKQKKERAAELLDLLNTIRACPPEFAADAMLRLIQANRIQEADWKKEVLEEAFVFAASAQEPIKRVAINVAMVMDTRPKMVSRSYEMNLDSLSLQCRVVNEMLALDKKAALDIFRRITLPKMPRVDCEEIYIYDPTIYYETASELARSGFTAKEMEKNDLFYFIQPLIYSMDTPLQIKPVINLLLRLPLPKSQLGVLFGDFSNSLRKVHGDDNSFSEKAGVISSAILELTEYCKKHNMPREDLLFSYRQYLLRHLSGSRCASRRNDRTPRQDQLIAQNVRFFNDKLRFETTPGQSPILPITADDAKPEEINGYCVEPMFWETLQAKEILKKFKLLRFPSEQELSKEEKESVQWQTDFLKYLDELMDWRGAAEKSEAEYLHQKMILLVGMTEIASTAALREAALRAMLRFLNSSTVYRDQRLEWFVHVDYLIRLSLSDYLHQGRTTLLRELKESRNPVLSLYAILEEIAPRKTK